ncbi:MAG: photosystem II protein Y [Cyanothece sp. SIO1E1]|nr:photosystem II protein Y [Cyanothece sp. SIO1E1]
MDLRLLLIFVPVLAALSWAVFNVFSPAKKQAEDFLEK